MLSTKKKDEDRKPIEQEIAELQRKFRVLENDKRAYSEDSQGVIRKQRATIEKLTRENRKMKAELNETRTSGGPIVESKMGLQKLTKMQEQSEKLTETLDVELRVARDLGTKVETSQDRIKKTRDEMATHGGCNAAVDNSRAVQKQIRILENRLDKALQDFNKAVASNRVQREQIDTLRRERVIFDDIYRKLENELQQKKKEMANIIEQANSAYEARDSAQAQMAALKQQADKEHAEFEKEWRELGRLIENDKKMKDFMRQKVRGAADDGKTGDKSVVDEDRHRKKITKNAWDTAKSLVNITSNQEKVAGFEESFAKVQAATGICDIDELAESFISAEDQNFTLFKYNSELSAEIEKLEQQIQEYEEERVVLSGNSTRKEDTEKVKVLAALETKWSDVDKKAVHYDLKHQEAQQTLTHVRSGVEVIFRRIGCTQDDLPSGVGTGISESNMLTYLGIVEQRTTDLLRLYDQMREDDDHLTDTRSKPEHSSANLQIRLPTTVEDHSDDEDDDVEDDQRPFTRDELKTKTLRSIQKRQKKSRAKAGAQTDK